MKTFAAEGDSEGLPRLTSDLVSHIVQQFNTEGIHALVKSLEYGDGAADELALLFINALRQYVADESTHSVVSKQPPTKVGSKMRIEAKQRLIADLTKKQEQLDINQDGKIDSTDLKKLRQGKKPVKSSNKVVAELQKMLSRRLVNSKGVNFDYDPKSIKEKDWQDYRNYPKWKQDAQILNKELLDNKANWLMETGLHRLEYKGKAFAAWSNLTNNGHIDVASLRHLIQSSLVDPTDGGASFDMLIDGEPEDEQPIVQELTQDDAGVEPSPEQELLVDDLQIM